MKKLILVILVLAAVWAYNNVMGEAPATTSTTSTITPTASTTSPSAKTVEASNGGAHSTVHILEVVGSKGLEVTHRGHTLAFNTTHNTPDWVAWTLTAEHADGAEQRSQKFWADPTIPRAYRVDYYDYKGSGYDRGHMCPAGDNKWSREAMHDCFYMSNMCPQEPSLNSGAWGALEQACRKWAVSEGEMHIVCGPIYEGRKHERIGIDHAVDVPEAFYKVVLSLRPGHEKAIGFYYRNVSGKQPMSQTATTVDDIERRTSLDFFSSLPDDIEQRLESACNLKDWL